MALSEERLEHIRCTLDALDEDVHGICTLRTIWWRDAMADLLSEHDRLAAEVERLRTLDAAMAGAWVHGCGSGCCPDYACELAAQRDQAQAEAKRLRPLAEIGAAVQRLPEGKWLHRRHPGPYLGICWEATWVPGELGVVGKTLEEALRAAGLMEEVSDGTE